jgi:hypothetical protein
LPLGEHDAGEREEGLLLAPLLSTPAPSRRRRRILSGLAFFALPGGGRAIGGRVAAHLLADQLLDEELELRIDHDLHVVVVFVVAVALLLALGLAFCGGGRLAVRHLGHLLDHRDEESARVLVLRIHTHATSTATSANNKEK